MLFIQYLYFGTFAKSHEIFIAILSGLQYLFEQAGFEVVEIISLSGFLDYIWY